MSQAHGLLNLYELGWLPRIRMQFTKERSSKCCMHCLFYSYKTRQLETIPDRHEALMVQNRPDTYSIRVIWRSSGLLSDLSIINSIDLLPLFNRCAYPRSCIWSACSTKNCIYSFFPDWCLLESHSSLVANMADVLTQLQDCIDDVCIFVPKQDELNQHII